MIDVSHIQTGGLVTFTVALLGAMISGAAVGMWLGLRGTWRRSHTP
ncbi:hypothetical protein J2D73_10855 [Acetobacter sacchari]|uniref:Uncharacterized protein n=1 Tax=Acetobacter sacchari TaxID=2661687 RepID=A0ABS3LWP0_9PROT|nr:hypothetical protein [Acetobacter sacchari]MBO1360286.1 hypothetical protein [Acetobacter sacchari]